MTNAQAKLNLKRVNDLINVFKEFTDELENTLIDNEYIQIDKRLFDHSFRVKILSYYYVISLKINKEKSEFIGTVRVYSFPFIKDDMEIDLFSFDQHANYTFNDSSQQYQLKEFLTKVEPKITDSFLKLLIPNNNNFDVSKLVDS